MRKYLLLMFFAFLSCNSKTKQETDNDISNCDDEWIFEKSNVIAKQINDSVTQEIVNGKLWFEIISPKNIGNGLTKTFIKNYRMNGSLESEGEAKYYVHPVADYKEVGLWKFYDCEQNLLKSKDFKR